MPNRRNAPAIAARLIRWYRKAARDLPWRRTTDPYRIWVAEIMLQQTQVRTVIPFWERWMRTLPTVQDLAEADGTLLHKLWEGLGYYTRVRNLQDAARQISNQHQGRFPTNHAEVMQLPGIGPYTAGAICSTAFNQPTAILDGNVSRVLSRLFGVTGHQTDAQTRNQLWKLAELMVTVARSAAPRTPEVYSCLNQSLMELGALICKPRHPHCSRCPVRADCVAFQTKCVDQLPTPRARSAITPRRVVAFVFSNRGRYLIRQRPAGVVNAHLWEFPNIETDETDPGRAAALAGFAAGTLSPLTTITHSITRYRITLEVYRGPLRAALQPGDPWRSLRQMHRLPFTSAHKKVLRLLSPVLTDK